jgi:hypothetical protein
VLVFRLLFPFSSVVCLLTLVACGDDEMMMPDGGGDAGDAMVDASPDAPVDGGDETAPVISNVLLAESTGSVLVWLLEFDTDEGATVEVDVTGAGGEAWTLTGDPIPATAHSLVIAGLMADTAYDISVRATDAADNTGTHDDSFTTGPLPSGLPPVSFLSSDPSRMAEGFTVFNVFRWLSGENAPDATSWIIAVDADGQIVWYATLPHRNGDVKLRDNGNLLYTYQDRGVVELDVMGNEVQRWYASNLFEEPVPGAIPVESDSMHHEILELPNGNFLTLGSELRVYGPDEAVDCPGWGLASGEVNNVVGDTIVELDPATGEIVQSISTFDDLDPCRRTTGGFMGGFWNAHYGGMTTRDWTHGNAVFYDEMLGQVIVSLRHSDWIVAYDYTPGDPAASGGVAWILGPEGEVGDYGSHASFTPMGADFEWGYHTHAPEITSTGDILFFDNGNTRPGTNFDPADAMGDADLPFSRAVSFTLDTGAMTATQSWEYRADNGSGGTRYAPFVGDADELDNGNVLVTYGGLVEPPSEAIADPANRKAAYIAEVENDGTVVFEIEVRDPAATEFTGYTVYRSERLVGFPR